MITDITYEALDAPVVKNKFEISVHSTGPYLSLFFDLYGDKETTINILNNFAAGKYKHYKDLKEFNEYYDEELAELEIKEMIARNYFDEFGRECKINNIFCNNMELNKKENKWGIFQVRDIWKFQNCHQKKK